MRNNGTLVAGVVVFVTSVAGVVTLELAGRDPGQVLTLAGPVVAALLVSGHVSNVTDRQNEQISRIEKQTNGVLDDRIKTQTLAALAEAGVVTPDGPPHAAPRLDQAMGEPRA
ncbi:hypothetical protein PZ938_07690 [Luteipulveratus sp. YIM 133132]|uniref:hypothetical protein n=1 Tax=Luteipulveratus flavus TaxID=3031728 RepID=UPI0023AF6DA6|nr:hypothetical protein [Luteipulveratus sp. YIM 133132]MDE9365484.1 hypothetical protein [Luteipulveratus sp. YIM 133132]